MKTVLALVVALGISPAPALAQGPQSYLPNPKLTPGDAEEVLREKVCAATYSRSEKIPIDVKRQVFDRYGVGHDAVGFNVDHLIPAKLGGSNSLKNLWPQPLAGEWNHHLKNRL